MRRLFTRCLGLVPALVVAAGLGRPGIDALLVASQVVLSIVLPFVVFPLVWLTSSRAVMTVKKPLGPSESVPSSSPSPTSPGPSQAQEGLELQVREDDPISASAPAPASGTADHEDGRTSGPRPADDAAAEAQPEYELVDFSNGRLTAGVGYAIWLVVVVANVYAIIGLALGQGA